MTKTVEDVAEVIGKWVAEGRPYPTTTIEIEDMLEWYYNPAGYTKADVETARRLLKELREQTVKEKIKSRKHTVQDVLELPDIPGCDEIACFINVEKMVSENKKQMFTFKVTAHSTTMHHEVLKALPDTQPTLGFQDGNPKPWSEVFTSLKELHQRYVYFRNETTYVITTLGAMSSYFREIFSTYPFLDFVAIEVSCGKTTALMVFCWSSFYGFVTITPTPAVIYRIIDQCKGVMGIDEIDNALENKEYRGPLTGVLNASYKKGLFAQRCAPRTNEVESYEPFGTKAFSRVKWIPRSLVDRSIQIPMMRASEHIKLDDLETSASFREVRDDLYNLRLHRSDQVREMVSWVKDDCKLTGRDREIFLAPLTIAKLVGDEVYTETLEWMKDYIKQKRSQADNPRMVVLVEVLLSHLGQPDVASTGIRDEYYALLEERNMMAENEKPSRSINKFLDKMDLRRSDKKTDNKTYFDIDREITLRWAKYYGFNLSPAQLDELDKLDKGGTCPKLSDFDEERERETGREGGVIPEPTSSNLPNSSDGADVHRKPLPREVKKFEKWLSLLPSAGQRGFKESDVKRAYGEGYLKQLAKYEKKSWIEQREDSKTWRISNTGEAALRGDP